MNEELTVAIEELRQRPTDRTWFLPVLLADGNVPDRTIGAGETLRDLHWINLDQDWQNGIDAIVRATVSPTTSLSKETFLLQPFIVRTLGVGNVGSNSAHLYGTASMETVKTWFDFADTPEVNYSIAALDGLGVAHTLKADTLYYFRYTGQNIKGVTVRGDILTFKTLHSGVSESPPVLKSPLDDTVDALRYFSWRSSKNGVTRDRELCDAVAAHLRANIPNVTVTTRVRQANEPIDILFVDKQGRAELVVEVAHSLPPIAFFKQPVLSQLIRQMQTAGVRDAVIYVHGDGEVQARSVQTFGVENGRVVVVSADRLPS